MTRKRLTRALMLAVAAACALGLGPAVAAAHVPAIEPRGASSDATGTAGDPYPGALRIDGPDISRAIYGYLGPNERFDAWTFEVAERVTADVGILVPVRPGTEGFRPRLLVATSEESVMVGSPPGQDRRAFFEPFTAERLYDSGSREVTFEPDRRYYLVVEPGSGERGDGPYTLTFSGAEAFSAGDWFDTLTILPRIYGGFYGQSPVRWGCFGALAIVLAPIVIVVASRRRRRTGLSA